MMGVEPEIRFLDWRRNDTARVEDGWYRVDLGPYFIWRLSFYQGAEYLWRLGFASRDEAMSAAEKDWARQQRNGRRGMEAR